MKMYNKEYHAKWYAKNRQRLLEVRRRYNAEYSKRPYVIAAAKMKNATENARKRRMAYKKTDKGIAAEGRYRKNNAESIKRRREDDRLMKRYGINSRQRLDMLNAQGNSCLICGASGKRLHIDHCHKTGIVRGMLCSKCNMGIGLFSDSVATLESAIRYLNRKCS